MRAQDVRRSASEEAAFLSAKEKNMDPIGYMAKSIFKCGDEFTRKNVADVFYVSSCISENICASHEFGKLNHFGHFNSVLDAQRHSDKINFMIPPNIIFFYEVFELEFDESEGKWCPIDLLKNSPPDIVLESNKSLEGYDVVSCTSGFFDCSPLTCNGLMENAEVNSHCLLSSFETARNLLESGYFKNCEPGPYRILSVWRI